MSETSSTSLTALPWELIASICERLDLKSVGRLEALLSALQQLLLQFGQQCVRHRVEGPVDRLAFLLRQVERLV